jgi:hypothetical protein
MACNQPHSSPFPGCGLSFTFLVLWQWSQALINSVRGDVNSPANAGRSMGHRQVDREVATSHNEPSEFGITCAGAKRG